MLIYKKIPLIMGEVGAIEKTRRGDGINYKFRGIDDIYSALQPLLSKHGVFFAPNVIAKDRSERQTKSGSTLTFTLLTVEFTFYADDGSQFKLVTVGEAMDTSDKSSNKAMSAALKYAMLQLFCIPTEEEKDTEYRHHEPLPDEQKQPKAPIFTERIGVPVGSISEPQRKRLRAIQGSVKMPDEKLKSIALKYGVTSSKEIPRGQVYDAICKEVESWIP